MWALQGGVDGPYPVGMVHVLVEEDEADAARALLTLEPEAEADDDEAEADGAEVASAWRGNLVAAVALVLVAVIGLARILALL